MRLSSRTLTLVTLAVVLVIVAVIIYYRVQAPGQGQTAPTDVDFQLDRQPTLGAPEAPVHIVTLEDFKCPICQRFERDVVPRIEQELIDTGRAKMSFVNFQFLGPDSTTAGIASECAYQQDEDLFWEYKEVIYRAQGPESQEWATPSFLTQLAREYVPDLDAEELNECIEERRTLEEVTTDNQIARASGATGTPTVFVNGERLADWQFNSIEQAVEQATAQNE